MKVIIIGAGESGKTLANILASEGHDVSIIEMEEELAKDIANNTDALVIKGDATDMSVLKDAGIEDANAIIATTTDDKTNLMVCEIAKSNKIDKIISRVNHSANEELFTKLGITSIVPVIGLTVTAIRRSLMSIRGERIIAQLGEGKVVVIAVTISDKSPMIGKPAVLKEAVIGSIYRNGDLIIPKPDTILESGDVLVVTTKTENLNKVASLISGE